VKAGTIPMGGVRVVAITVPPGHRFSTLTDAAGAYSIALPKDATYVVRADFRGVTSASDEISFGETGGERELDFSLVLNASNQAAGSTGTSSIASLWPPLQLPPVTTNSIAMQPASGSTGGSSGAQFPSFAGDASFSGDTFSVNGQTLIVIPYFQMADQMRQDFEDGHELTGASVEPVSSNATSSTSSGGSSSGSASSSSNSQGPHGQIFWTGGNSAVNAQPFVIAGQPAPSPGYHTNGYGVTAGLQPYLPGITKPSARDSLVLSYSGQISTTLVNDYGIVPTEEEREGNFSHLIGSNGALIPIYAPRDPTPYPNNTINTPLNPAALALLQYIPEPNLESTGINYRLLSTQGTHTNTLGASYTHSFGALANSQTGAGGTQVQGLTQTLYMNFNFGDVATDVINIFPALGGKQRVQGYSVTAGYTETDGNWITTFNVNSSRNNSQVTNFFTNQEDVASKSGVFADNFKNPINTNPLDWGLPNLVFNNFTGVSETQPNFQLTQITGVSGAASWTHGPHVLRFGGDLHHVDFNLFGGVNATGTYIFTGGYTQQPAEPTGNAVATTGSSFADFLLGLQQESKLESPDQKAYTRQTNWDLFVRDDWRVLRNLTLCLGLRYDYFSPFVEKYDRLSTLDYNADFSATGAVQPDQAGPVSGAQYPRSLIKPDRDNFSPHVGLAWQASRGTTVRAAYGINYGVGQYGGLVQYLAYQPPFANVQANVNIPHDFTLNTLEAGFGDQSDIGNFAISRKYRLPYVGTWYLDVQRSVPLDIVLDVGYTGAKGTRLDVVSAPGVINTLPFASAFFDFDDSEAFSKFNALVVRANKRMRRGLALQATYSYSHSIDNASSTNAGSVVVAQNPNNLLAEESNSSFDIRHQVTGSFLYQLPFGSKQPFLNSGSWASRVFGDWSLSGFLTLATGVPLTPYISASVAEVERGTHGSVRPNRVQGVSITEGGGKLDHWFNTAAFSATFSDGQIYGTASRYSIPGPGQQNLNLSLSKVISFHESRSLELRATANNALNIVQYSGVNTQISSSTFGFVDAVQPMRQFTFLARLSF
jgi:trimeric autotransporter adhesin